MLPHRGLVPRYQCLLKASQPLWGGLRSLPPSAVISEEFPLIRELERGVVSKGETLRWPQILWFQGFGGGVCVNTLERARETYTSAPSPAAPTARACPWWSGRGWLPARNAPSHSAPPPEPETAALSSNILPRNPRQAKHACVSVQRGCRLSSPRSVPIPRHPSTLQSSAPETHPE